MVAILGCFFFFNILGLAFRIFDFSDFFLWDFTNI